jgi:hypothetical protein
LRSVPENPWPLPLTSTHSAWVSEPDQCHKGGIWISQWTCLCGQNYCIAVLKVIFKSINKVLSSSAYNWENVVWLPWWGSSVTEWWTAVYTLQETTKSWNIPRSCTVASLELQIFQRTEQVAGCDDLSW